MRVQRNSVLVENTNGFHPMVTKPIHVDGHRLYEKTFTICFVSEQEEFLCVEYKNTHPTGCVKWSRGEKDVLWIKKINDTSAVPLESFIPFAKNRIG